jgi:protein TonB
MKKDKKSKKFLNLPLYPGGKSAFQEFIRENLRYPEEAFKHKIEGKVYIGYQVNDNGEVIDAHIIKGIGYGCDEEAIRVVKLLSYNKVSNRGMRLVSSMKTTIGFKLNETRQGLKYNYVQSKPDIKDSQAPPKVVYGYTINFTKPD